MYLKKIPYLNCCIFMPGMHSMMESMIDPFAMFVIQRQNWWEGQVLTWIPIMAKYLTFDKQFKKKFRFFFCIFFVFICTNFFFF
jgi:hypothetical protein